MSTNLSPVLLPDDQLDSGFSGDGLVSVAVGAGDDRARAIVSLADTGYLVAGSTATATDDDFVQRRDVAVVDFAVGPRKSQEGGR